MSLHGPHPQAHVPWRTLLQILMPLPPLLQLLTHAWQVALTTTDYCSLEVGVLLFVCWRGWVTGVGKGCVGCV